MADITHKLDSLLRAHSTHLAHPRRTSGSITDEFLKEAYRINAHISSLHFYLRSIRQSYLNTSQPQTRTLHRSSKETPQRSASPFQSSFPQSHHHPADRKYLNDKQRDEIDAVAKFTLRDLNASITQLRTAEQIRQDTASQVAIAHSKKLHGGLGALGRWAAGGGNPQGEVKTPEEELEDARQNTIKVYRENVLWYLGRKLEEAGEQQRSMMEIRLEREVERSKSSLSKSRGFVGARGVNGESEGVNGMEGGSHADRGSTMNGGVDTMPAAAGHKRGLSKEARKAAAIEDEERETIESNLSPEQLQLFEQENSEMLKHYEDTLDQVRTAEKSLLEISSLQTTLVQNLSTQSEYIDQLVSDSMTTTENIGGGNKELKRAAERKSTARMVFLGTVGLCTFLVGWDLIF
ncbi:hypothetical protein MMC09_000780 [Bachmanniomyces sp. S44760]|nr:hypothetical protein [Bachmanniomyces sp. S44760]